MEKKESNSWQRSGVYLDAPEIHQKGSVHISIRLARGTVERDVSRTMTVKDSTVSDVFKFIERSLFGEEKK